MEAKKPIQSKSLWFNILSIVAIAGAGLLADDNFREMIGSNAIYLIIVVNIVNMLIRGYTDKPISLDKAKTQKPLNPLEEALKKDAEEINQGA